MSTEREDPAGRTADAPSRPVLRVVRGNPTSAEIAALTAIVSAATAQVPELEASAPRGRWCDPAHSHRGALRPGPGAWRATGR